VLLCGVEGIDFDLVHFLKLTIAKCLGCCLDVWLALEILL
jgi:hypothetical protein